MKILTERTTIDDRSVHIAGPPEPTTTGPVQCCLRCDLVLPTRSGDWWEIGESLVVEGEVVRRAGPRATPPCEPNPDDFSSRIFLG